MSRIAKIAAVALGTSAVVISGAGLAMADADAQGAAVGSPGVLSGNVVQVPIHVPVNICGNTISAAGLLNPAFGNTCANVSDHDKGGYDKGGYDKHHDSDKHGDNGYGD
ncbi:chaplin [Streptomyces sp. 3214.6]|uniref:chaplin n=1 Tax=Streptomyces sp. 3214.6 TaxID=1882757 RepID=UPI00090B30A1|nr:chaplin [Streptomyces sp. 3214.6]SHI22819.1 Small secreted domain [Streptomyces sp. 3214.6]